MKELIYLVSCVAMIELFAIAYLLCELSEIIGAQNTQRKNTTRWNRIFPDRRNKTHSLKTKKNQWEVSK